MELITRKSEFIEALKDFHSVEVLAKGSYEEDISEFVDEHLIEKIKKIKIDEEKHIALLEDLIQILSKDSS